jgi:translation elongation factor EF-Tu-like GTPase
MAPPVVRAGFSGLQTRDHTHLVRVFTALKPILARDSVRDAAHEEFIDSVVSAYAAHEYICARFRGDVLPSLRMAATSRGRTQRSGVDVIRELMRARLALIDPPAGRMAD